MDGEERWRARKVKGDEGQLNLNEKPSITVGKR